MNMKKLILTAGALILLAAPCFAYMSPGNLSQNTRVNGTDKSHSNSKGDNPVNYGGRHGHDQDPIDDRRDPFATTSPGPAHPVPEPGTMAIASMGLLAVGVALRSKRSS